MRAAMIIAVKDLRQKVGDRSALFLAVLAPLGLAFLFSLMIPSQGDFHATYVVVRPRRRPARARGCAPVPSRGSPTPTWRPSRAPDSEADARAQVEAGDADAAIVIPVGFSDAIQAGEAGEAARSSEAPGPSRWRSPDPCWPGSAARSRPSRSASVPRWRRPATHPSRRSSQRLAQDAIAIPAPIVVAADTTAERQASSTTYYGASMAVLFVFFAAQFGVVGLLAERRTGTLARMLASPIGPSSILLGKVLVSLVISIVSMSVMVIATTLLLGARWGDPLAVAALIGAMAIAATGIATLVVGFARTEEQAGGAIAIVALTLAVLGGSFFPLSQAPEGMASLSLITPHAWFLRGINDLAGGGSIGTVAFPSWCCSRSVS